MHHMFDVSVAEMVGVNAAILFQNIAFWCQHSQANDTNYYDGNYWTYSSNKAFRSIFTYLTGRQVDTAIKKLLEAGLIVKGNYNKSAYDRTMWYAVTNKGKSILQKCEMEKPEKANGKRRNVEPIPDINTDIDTDINTSSIIHKEMEMGAAQSVVTVQRYASENLTTLGARAMDEINSFADDLSEDIVRHAIDNALDHGARSWSYVRAILNRYCDEGIKTVGEAKASDEAFAQRKKHPEQAQREYKDADYENDW